MSRKLFKYRVYCNTEDKYEYIWNDILPTICPSNVAHTIDTNTISIIDTLETNSVNIIQESIITGGNYRTEGKKIVIQANSTTTQEYSWQYNISALTITFYTGNNENDILNCFVAPNTVIGALTNDVVISDTVLNVNSTVIDNIKVGYQIVINNEFIGECIEINKINNTITSNNAVTQNYNTGTYIQMTVNPIKDFILKSNTLYEFARKTIGSSSIPANTIIKLQYQNTTNEEKNLFFSIEYMY